jgi:glucose/arabinose dehydrogenase
MTFRPGTQEIWIGDVGYHKWEEIDRIPSATDAVVENFGWPCYEGAAKQPAYDAANLNICESLYATPSAVTPPYFTYAQLQNVVPGETCPNGSASISGIAFYSGSSYPASYAGALFFADYSRQCMWVIPKGASGQPDPAAIAVFGAGVSRPVDIKAGPNGDLFYVDLLGGTIRRIQYTGATRLRRR